MGALDGRVVIITGAGRGIGREHALLFAAEGARVVVNDAGAGVDGRGEDPAIATGVVDEIVAAGGDAVAVASDVTTMDGAQATLDTALATYGRVDVLVNNAGILRDKMFANMSEDDWDAAIAGHLKAAFAPTRLLAAHWRDLAKAGEEVKASVVSTSSTSGLIGAVGQSNYGAAKAAIAAMTVIIAEELGRYGVRVNAITPGARTRMTETMDLVQPPADPSDFDVWHPGNVSPLVAWLATEECPVTGEVFYVKGGEVRQFLPWSYGKTIDAGRRWTVADLGDAMTELI